MQTIFITIPSYEDPYLIRTLESALSNAKNPNAIKFAIALQYKKFPSPDVSKYTKNYISYEVEQRPSINLIRNKLLEFYNNEDYFMMIDSHTLFMKNWDEILINDYQRLQKYAHNKIIISKQVPPACGELPFSPNEKTIWHLDDCRADIVGSFSASLVGRMETQEVNEEFFKTNYASAHFFFTSGNYVKEVGIVEAASVRSEEPVMSFVSFLNGWDIYGVNTRNHIAHMDLDYSMAVYGEPHPPKRLKFNFSLDDEKTIRELDMLLINNTGRFAVKNAERSAKDFYSSVGLLNKWEQVVNNSLV